MAYEEARAVAATEVVVVEMVEVEMVEQRMVEYHVDFMRIEDRLRLHPYWGGDMSTRVDKTKVRRYHLPLSLL